MTTLTFGKHKGCNIKDIPVDYLEWGVSKLDSPKWRKEFKRELDRRESESQEQEVFIKQNINSPEVWEMLVKEAEKELSDQENFALDNDCQYDGRIISQKEINELAKEKLEKYQTEIRLEQLDAEFMQKWGVNKNQIDKIQDAYWNDELERLCSSPEKFKAANELAAKRSKLIAKIYKM